MNFLEMLWWLKGEFLKNKLLQAWFSPNDIQWVDFNNIDDLNRLAEKLVPKIIQNNPNIKNMLKQNASMLGQDKQKEVCEIIDMN